MSVNNDGTKLASGGLDGKVKIWDLPAILNYKDKSDSGLMLRMDTPEEQPQRALASMSRHNGVVTCVKFSPDGRFLASGSDDKIVLIWEKDDATRPKQFGETEADLEHWSVRKRLVAHDNDVQDICWSPDGLLLITVGLDRSIIIWNGVTFERIKRYDVHQSMVKGIVFDPANKFFATASDDRSVRIFRYHRKLNESSNYEFQMEQMVMDPFKKSPLTSYFRRMSWSPDGQHIAVPNATNGPITSVVIINRGNWASDVSLIGHEAPCEVCSFSPRMFRLPGKEDTYSTVLASGGQDRTLAIWSTALTKPLVVAEDIVANSITDICWTPDGQSLFLSSLDGSVTCVTFDEHELGEPVGAGAMASQLVRFGGDRDSTISVESANQLALESLANINATKKPQPTVTRSPTPAVAPAPKPETPTVVSPPQKKVTKLNQNVVITQGGKKRVAPTLVSTYSSKTTTVAPSSAKVTKTFNISSKLSKTSYFLPRLGLQSAVHGLRLRSTHSLAHGNQAEDADNDNEDMGLDESSALLLLAQSGTNLKRRLRKHRKWLMVQKYPTPFKMVSNLPEVLFTNQSLMSNELTKLIQSKDLVKLNGDLVNTAALESVDENLYFQVVVSSVEHIKKSALPETEDSDKLITSVVEVRNGPTWPEEDEPTSTDFAQRLDFQDPTQVIVSSSDEDMKKYILYFPFRIQQVIPIVFGTDLVYYVLISFDGLVQIIRAESGNYVTPAMELGSNVVAWKQGGQNLLLLTSAGLVYCWKLPYFSKGDFSLKSIVNGVSVAPVLHSEVQIKRTVPNPKSKKAQAVQSVVVDNIKAVEVDPITGTPYIVLQSSSSIYAYNQALQTWVKEVDSWYFQSIDEAALLSLNTSDLKKQLMKRGYKAVQTKIQTGSGTRYIFVDENKALAQTMQLRFKELAEL